LTNEVRPEETRAVAAIHNGDVETLKRILHEHPNLAHARVAGRNKIGDGGGPARTLLHVATDWPGHFPNSAATVAALLAAGADVNAAMTGAHAETPLHWAASTNDVAALDALLDWGADIEAPGSVIGGGTALADAVAFGQWEAARRLVERGARTTLWQAAALGMMAHLEAYFAADAPPSPEEVTNGFWCACHGGQRTAAAYLLERGADLNWIGYNELTALDAAKRSGAKELVDWLRSLGGKSTAELR
jgi:uncharacterized protein